MHRLEAHGDVAGDEDGGEDGRRLEQELRRNHVRCCVVLVAFGRSCALIYEFEKPPTTEALSFVAELLTNTDPHNLNRRLPCQPWAKLLLICCYFGLFFSFLLLHSLGVFAGPNLPATPPFQSFSSKL